MLTSSTLSGETSDERWWKMPFISSHSLNSLSHRHIADKRLCVSSLGVTQSVTLVTVNTSPVSRLTFWPSAVYTPRDTVTVFLCLKTYNPSREMTDEPIFHLQSYWHTTSYGESERWRMISKSFIDYIHTTNLHPFPCKERTYRQLSIFFLMTLTE